MVCLALLPTSAFAHTGLENSTPQNQQVVSEVKEIVLQFNTKVEKTSTFTVKSEQGEVIEVNNVEINGKVLKGEITKPLQDGSYTVNWKIVGTDGHPIEGNFAFVVKNTQKENPVPSNSQGNGPSSNNPTNNLINQPSSNTSDQPQSTTPQKSAHTENPAVVNSLLWGTAVLFCILLGTLLWTLRKKGK
nr:copper resistance protein CopC [Brevibacillus agri]